MNYDWNSFYNISWSTYIDFCSERFLPILLKVLPILWKFPLFVLNTWWMCISISILYEVTSYLWWWWFRIMNLNLTSSTCHCSSLFFHEIFEFFDLSLFIPFFPWNIRMKGGHGQFLIFVLCYFLLLCPANHVKQQTHSLWYVILHKSILCSAISKAV
jgi:hypothetical protein